MLNQNNSANNIILWGTSVSPYVRKVMVALAEKNLQYQHKEILPKLIADIIKQELPSEFNAISPLGKIPAIQIDDFSISDSAVIIAYLEKKFATGNKLLPIHPEEYARALWFENYSDVILTNVAYKKIFLEVVIKPNVLKLPTDEKLLIEAKENELPIILNFLDASIAQCEWFSGHSFSIADVSISTQLLALAMAGVTLDKRWSHLQKHHQKVIARPSFAKFV